MFFLPGNLGCVFTESYLATFPWQSAIQSASLSRATHQPGMEYSCCREKPFRTSVSVSYLERYRPIFQRLSILTVYGQYAINSLLHIKENYSVYEKKLDVHRHNIQSYWSMLWPSSYSGGLRFLGKIYLAFWYLFPF